MNKIRTALSLFNGYGGCILALQELGIKVDKYYSSEIDKYANQAANALYPETIQLGDITKWREWDIDWGSIDLLIGGSPCQGFSFAGKQLAFDDPRSKLFFCFVEILSFINSSSCKPVKFMLENVKMKTEHLEVISGFLNSEPILINSALVSAQNRNRYYWSNGEKINQPKDRKIFLIDILEDLPDCPIGIKVREKSKCLRVGGRNTPFGSKQEWDIPFQRVTKKGKIKPGIEKAACLTGGANSGGNHSDMDIIHSEFFTRRYSVRECGRLQGMPEHKIDTLLNCGISNTQLYKMLGNGWTHDVIVHIFKGLL